MPRFILPTFRLYFSKPTRVAMKIRARFAFHSVTSPRPLTYTGCHVGRGLVSAFQITKGEPRKMMSATSRWRPDRHVKRTQFLPGCLSKGSLFACPILGCNYSRGVLIGKFLFFVRGSGSPTVTFDSLCDILETETSVQPSLKRIVG